VPHPRAVAGWIEETIVQARKQRPAGESFPENVFPRESLFPL